jgi:hypothetical protein
MEEMTIPPVKLAAAEKHTVSFFPCYVLATGRGVASHGMHFKKTDHARRYDLAPPNRVRPIPFQHAL